MNTQTICAFFLFVFLASGCASHRTSVLQKSIWESASEILGSMQGEVKDLSLQQIKDTVISNRSKLKTFRAKVKFSLATSDSKGPIHCNGVLLYKSPESLRTIGSKFATTVFDMSIDGNMFWLHIPPEKKFYTGTCSTFRKIETLDIKIFPGDMTSMFNYNALLEGEKTALEVWPTYWFVRIMDIEENDVLPKGNLLIDRINGDAFRCELFHADGSVRLQAVFRDYDAYDGCRVPRKIDVRWPGNNAALSIEFSDIVINEALDPKVFRLTAPEGVKTISFY
ncbi:MAG: DUF4292 domain-containing protein [Candidatus Brocadiaceae bacterium]|nr:DUF4292 domain-containing protein [Candidatus Brocadiaceae bacterium]